LCRLVVEGAQAASAKVFDLGEVTTPQLHFAVRKVNRDARAHIALSGDSCGIEVFNEVYDGLFDALSIDAALGAYYDSLAEGFVSLVTTSGAGGPPIEPLILDASYGLGSKATGELIACVTRHVSKLSVADSSQQCIDEKFSTFKIDIRNPAGRGPVNEGCGAELVQKEQLPPCGVDALSDKGKLICSFDGDADRVVFHMFKESAAGGAPEWVLLDGDKIACLAAVLICNDLNEAFKGSSDGAYTVGCVQVFLRMHYFS